MAILKNLLAILDGGLGIVLPGGRPVAVVGCCTSGAINTPTTCYTPAQLVAAGGAGPAVEDAAILLKLSGGPVLLCRAATVTAAVLGGFSQSGTGSSAAGTITAGGGNTSTAVLALTGTPDERYAVLVKVTVAGSNLAASPKIAISLDGGVTYLAAQTAVAGPTAIGTTGLSIGITDGTFVVGDTFSAVGANSATPADATGTSVPAFTGTPTGEFHIIAEVTTAAASLTAPTAAVRFSLDDGRSFGEPVGIPANGVYAIPGTGVTVTFGAGTFVVSDIFELRTAPPLLSTTTLDAALASLAPRAGDYEFVHVAGAIDATHAATLKAWGIAREAAGEYVFALGGARDQATGESVTTWTTALGTTTPGFSGFDGQQYLDVHGSAGYVESALYPGNFFRRNLAVLRSARLASIPVNEHPGDVRTGAIAGLMPDGDGPSVIHDGLAPAIAPLDAYRFSLTQRVLGQPRGRWFFTSRTMALATSDFGEIQRVRVICLAATATLAAMSLYVGSDPEVKTDGSGQIAEPAAVVIEEEVNAALRRAVVDAPNGFAVRIAVAVDRTTDVLATGALTAAVSVVPKGSINTVSTTITYARSA